MFVLLLTGLSLFCLMALSGCGSPPELKRRLAGSRDLLRSYPEHISRRIERGELAKGMTREQVHLAIGVPDDIQREVSAEGRTEKWLYKRPSGNDLELYFVGDGLKIVNPIVKEEASEKVRAARAKVLSMLDDADLSEAVSGMVEGMEGKGTGSLEGALHYNPTGKDEIPLGRETVTLAPFTARWSEVLAAVEREKALRKGLPKLMTLRIAFHRYEALFPESMIFETATDDEGRFRIASIPPGRWIAAVDLSSEYGFYLWFVTVEIRRNRMARIDLGDGKTAAAYKLKP